MLLSDLLYRVAIRQVRGSTDIEISDLQIDSRKIGTGAVFVSV